MEYDYKDIHGAAYMAALEDGHDDEEALRIAGKALLDVIEARVDEAHMAVMAKIESAKKAEREAM